jgi:DNA polymerase-3 subunit epsilon
MADFKHLDRISAIGQARMIRDAHPIFLDTETTGLGDDAEICDIAVVDSDGQVILNTLVHPLVPIPPEVTAIHGITNEMVDHAPTMAEVWPLLRHLLSYRPIVTYNAAYDSRLISQSLYAACRTKVEGVDYRCAMLLFSQWYGDWNDYRKSYKWQRLDVAAQCAGFPAWSKHRALGDTLAARAVLLWLAGQEG